MPLNGPYALCGARSKQNNHLPCRQPAMKNGRCRLHGGKCTGPKTPEGKERSARANYKHGKYSKEAALERSRMRMMMQWKKDIKDI
jgi:hypothetical protein